MSTSFSRSSALCRSLALALVTGSAFAVAGAQIAPPAQSAGTAQPVNFSLAGLGSASTPMFSESSSASSSVADAGANAANTNLASLETNFRLPDANAQYGRRRYGATRYRGSNTNADGSEKYTFFAGAGFATPAATEFNYATTGWGIQGGGGRNFNRHVGVDLEFDYDHFGMSNATTNNQQNLYNYYIGLYNATPAGFANPVTPITGLGGNNHIWSFSLDPTYNIYSGQGLGAYVIGGAGFYHKVANFTVPAQGEYCDYYGFCYAYTANQNIDHYTSNALGLNGGIGFTYKFSRFANEKLYGEVRYVYIFNSARPGVTVDNASAANSNVNNDFPQNSNRTPYLPVKFGIRF
jgi:hypothetical protein